MAGTAVAHSRAPSGRDIVMRSPLRAFAVVALATALTLLPSGVDATWSIIAVDANNDLVVIASATCVSAQGLRSRGGLMSIQAVIVPGVGVAAAQAGVNGTRANQTLIYQQMLAGTDPDQIIRMLSADEAFQRRQFGIVDLQGRMAGFSGAGNGFASLAVQSEIRGEGIYFAIQGNILESDDVVLDAVAAFMAEEGTVTDRVMAAMEAADRAGGDARCSCRTDPVPETESGCRHRTAHVAYIAAAKPSDPAGDGHSDGEYSLFIDVDDENTTAAENPNPVTTLRMRYDAWKAGGGAAALGSR